MQRLFHGKNLPLALAFAIGLAPVSRAQTASVSGRVSGSDGAPLIALLQVSSAGTTSALSMSATSGSDGSFQLSNLPAGSYQVCVTVKGGGYLDPCLWNTSGIVISVAAGQSLSGQAIQVQKAAILHVRVNDPQNLRSVPQAGASRQVMMGVFAPGSRFYPMILKSSDSTGTDHEISIPAGTTVPFAINPVGVNVSDAAGKAVDAIGSTVSLVLSQLSLSTPTVLTYNVTGLH